MNMFPIYFVLGIVFLVFAIIQFCKFKYATKAVREINNDLTNLKNHLIFGCGYQIAANTEMNIWLDPELIAITYPGLSKSKIKRIMNDIEKRRLCEDAVFVTVDSRTLLNVPKVCYISFGTSWEDCGKKVFALLPRSEIHGSYILVERKLTSKSICIKTVKRF